MHSPDVAIVGAGPVGAALAALAADSGLSIELYEARSAPSADRRTLALSHASRAHLEECRHKIGKVLDAGIDSNEP